MNLPKADPHFTISPGSGGLPRLTMIAPDGGRAEVYFYAAHVASWQPSGDSERLFLSRASVFAPPAAIRGGVPLIFPQFGGLGPLRQHGFARRMGWEFVAADIAGEWASATFQLRDSDETRAQWPHCFVAELIVSLGGRELAVTLAVTNADAAPLAFTAALHTYLAVADLAGARVEGLAGLRYRDHAAAGAEAQQVDPAVTFEGEVDRLYFNTPSELRLVDLADSTRGLAGRTTLIRSEGFPDAVVWNPGAVKCAAMADLEPEDYRRYVCVEAAAAGAPVVLAPGERWQGTQTLLA